MREMLSEIWASMRKNKLRTFLTGFSVAWGIFMLIMLLGTGNGLQNGIMENFQHMGTNTIRVSTWRTSEAYGGYPKGRRIRLTNKDMEIIEKEFPEAQSVVAEDYGTSGIMTYGKEYVNVDLDGVMPEALKLEKIDIVDGRFINRQDLNERRKVVVIDNNAAEILFAGKSPIGKTVLCGGIAFTVVGVYKTMFNQSSSSSCYIPLSVGQMIYRAGDTRVWAIFFELPSITTDEGMADFEKRLIARLAAEHNFSPTDESAIWIRNNFEMFRNISKVFNGISAFIWVIAIATLLAGIVGVSNIMLVTVRERTFEFGIRKALGAKPRSLIRLVLIEAVAITAIFGYIGMLIGIAAMELFNKVLESSKVESTSDFGFTMFVNPTVDLSSAISATVVLIVAGIIAGYVPARKAAQIKTIDALRYNQ